VILMMGMAGSGKGTQGELLADQQKLHLISMGDVVRMYITGKKRAEMLAGKLLKDEDIIKILERVLASLRDDDEVILDGFPRTIPQAEWLLEQVKNGRFDLKAAFHLLASREAVKRRMLDRARIDDTEEAIDKRIDEYEKSTKPLLKWLAKSGVKVVNIDAERSVEAINQDILSHLKQA
jgi:adenylate kinase